MFEVYTTKEGDVLDAICFKHYKKEGMTEQVLIANKSLCTQPVVLPLGLQIKLPMVVSNAGELKRGHVMRIWG